jgi:hypothetical protein
MDAIEPALIDYIERHRDPTERHSSALWQWSMAHGSPLQ